ncbi:ketoacyl-ACP synthase III [Clostridium algidicarnis]|uniref:beta-ketoacyl-ACP synthase III n=1 Tax=Clostridium algidicarnis TaxID=37659 RepID=UPI001C0BE378|nr:beta-ketoacyl-ACP synthase III [Clostridium algidicarnis]MBU3208200.1 ketoacyl-ACP synthase III [Clostridium algidicarnis]
MSEVKIIGTGSYIPKGITTNDDLSKWVDTSDEWISSRTGIKERRLSIGENTSELASKSAIDALKDANMKAEDIELIIVATITSDSFTPSTACMVQESIGAFNAVAFDISAACSGFIFGLNTAYQFIKAGQMKNALVIGAEVLSKIVDFKDRNTCVLFGDGAGAAILKASNKQGILYNNIGSDGINGKDSLNCTAVQLSNPYTRVEKKEESFISMNGKEVFRFAVKIIPKSIEQILKYTNNRLEDIKYIIPHQANLRIVEFAAKKLKVDIEKFYVNLDRYGNTSSASIPIALDEMNKNGLLKKGDKIILVGFGGGLTWGSTLIKW